MSRPAEEPVTEAHQPMSIKIVFVMYLFKFEPLLKQTLWGGDKIRTYKHLHNTLPHVGESWELSGVKGNESTVSNGPLAGRTITELIEEYGEQFACPFFYHEDGDDDVPGEGI